MGDWVFLKVSLQKVLFDLVTGQAKSEINWAFGDCGLRGSHCLSIRLTSGVSQCPQRFPRVDVTEVFIGS